MHTSTLKFSGSISPIGGIAMSCLLQILKCGSQKVQAILEVYPTLHRSDACDSMYVCAGLDICNDFHLLSVCVSICVFVCQFTVGL